jgi:hypothetical protein
MSTQMTPRCNANQLSPRTPNLLQQIELVPFSHWKLARGSHQFIRLTLMNMVTHDW